MAIREHVEHPVTIEYTIRVGRGRKGVLANGRATLPTPFPVDSTIAFIDDQGQAYIDRATEAEATEAEVNARVGNMLAGWTAPVTIPTTPEEDTL